MIFFLMNAAHCVSVEDECLKAVNEYRAGSASPPLKMRKQLNNAARVQSAHQKQTSQCTHDGPPGNGDVSERIRKANYKTNSWAENVAQGNQKGAGEAFEIWKNSPPHCRNMLSPEYDETGLACENSDDGKSYWTQVFAKSSGQSADQEQNGNPVTPGCC